MALAALVARDAPGLFLDHVAHLVQGNLDIFEATGAPCFGGGGARRRAGCKGLQGVGFNASLI